MNLVKEDDFYVVRMKEWCATDLDPVCPEGTQFEFLMDNVMNPSTSKPSSTSYSVTLQTSDAFLIASRSTDIFAYPSLSAGPFEEASISSSNNRVGMSTTISIDVKLRTALAQEGSSNHNFRVQFPTEFYYLMPETEDLECMTQGSTVVPCNFEATIGTMGNEIQSVLIDMACETFSCDELSERSFKINNLRNRFSTRPASFDSVITL